jgi:hypothetical protein
MTKSELRQRVMETGSHFFDRSTMRFFGDTMANYGVLKNPVDINGVQCWVLYRRKPVKHGLCSSAYFDCQTFKRVHKLEG